MNTIQKVKHSTTNPTWQIFTVSLFLLSTSFAAEAIKPHPPFRNDMSAPHYINDAACQSVKEDEWAVLADAQISCSTVPKTVIVSASLSGDAGNSWSRESSISGNGRFIVFKSKADNLVLGDFNGFLDVFVRDLATGVTRRVSVNSNGAEGNGNSGDYEPGISANGRYVAFASDASNLVEGDTNQVQDVFVHDMVTGATRRVSMNSNGAEGNERSNLPSISATGRYIAFQSLANNIVSGDTNNDFDIFVHDLKTGITRLVSVSRTGAASNLDSDRPNISSNGRFVTFYSPASNLVENDNNDAADIFVRDLIKGITYRASISTEGVEANEWSFHSSLSADGRFVVFESDANNLVAGDNNNIRDVFVHDLKTRVTQRISVSSVGVEGNSWSFDTSISANGRYVAFTSDANNLVSGDNNSAYDIFIRDVANHGVIKLVSVNNQGEQGNSYSAEPSISADGRFVAFSSLAGNLVTNDINNSSWDIFVHRQW